MLPSISFAVSPLTVYTVNYPLAYFAERIGGEHVAVTFPVPADVDPVYWMPDRETIRAYQRADLILLNGAGYARWTNKVTLPRAKMVDTSRAFRDRYIYTKEATTHNHGTGGEHAHENLAFTTWLDLSLALEQGEAIKKALIRKRPSAKASFEQNYAQLATDLRDLDKGIREIVSLDPSRPLIVSHPVYGYLARGYGLKIKSVHWEPEELPDGSQWREFRKTTKDHPARWMIWEGEPREATVEKLMKMGVSSTVFDPCGNVPEKGNFMTVMTQNVAGLRRIFE